MLGQIIKRALPILTLALCSAAQAGDWPAQPVRILTAFGPGTASDMVARMIAEDLQNTFKQPFIVENKPGASGILAATAVAEAAPDGYTLFLTTNTANSANPYLFKKLPYDPVASFTPIARVCNFPFVLAVEAKLPVNSVAELIQYSHKTPNGLSYAYGNSTGQVAGAAFKSLTGLKATAIPYKSTPQAMTDLIGGQVAFMFVDLASSQPNMQAGRLRTLAVSTEKRSALVPELPTVAEAANLPGFDLAAWVGVMGPAGLPQEITEQLSTQINRMLARPDVVAKLTAMGAEVSPAPAAEFADYLQRQLVVWKTKVNEAGIQAE